MSSSSVTDLERQLYGAAANQSVGDAALSWFNNPTIPGVGNLLPTGYVFQSHGRNQRMDPVANMVTGRPYGMLCYTPIPRTLTTISQLCAGGTSFAAVTDLWFEVWDVNRNIIAKTVNDGATGWVNGSTKALALTTPLNITPGTSFYLATCGLWTTPGTILGINSGNGNAGALPPVIAGQSSDVVASYAAATIGFARGALTNNPFQPYFLAA